MTLQIRHATYRAETHIKTRADGKTVVTGYASVFGSKNSFDEVFLPGAFSKTLKSRKERSVIVHLLHHDERLALGAPVLSEDSKGLHFETQPLEELQSAQQGLIEIRAGILNGVSLGFSFRRNKRGEITGVEWVEEEKGGGRLEISTARVWEISNVRWGADPAALSKVATRGLCVCEGRCLRCRAEAVEKNSSLDVEMIRRASLDISLPLEARSAAREMLRALEQQKNETAAPLLGGVFDALGAFRAALTGDCND